MHISGLSSSTFSMPPVSALVAPASILFTHDDLYHLGRPNRLPPCFTMDPSCPLSINVIMQHPAAPGLAQFSNISLLNPGKDGFRSLFEIEVEVMRAYRGFLQQYCQHIDAARTRVDRIVCPDPVTEPWHLVVAAARVSSL
ncbi:hypothetical protein HGRIS_011384 [Hohenbuehelia grisea]|uniref:Uncharacterized protein n=1 Tax=Hohenbuehelia grisea TaxID=104357 RepID=A0ABR3JV14_9AGAR